MLLSISITQLPKAAFYEYGHSFIDNADKSQTITQRFAKSYESLKVAFAEVDRIYKIPLKSPQTAEIESLDIQRGGIKSAIKRAAEAMSYSTEEKTRRLAIALLDTFGSFKVENDAKYSVQTGQLDILISVLFEQHSEALEYLGLLPLAEQLRSVNQQFHDAMNERFDENIDKEKGAFEAARTRFEILYKDFVDLVNSFIRVCNESGATIDEDLLYFIEKTNVIINYYKRTVLNGSTNTNSPGDPTNPDDSTPDEPNDPDGPNPNPDGPNPTLPGGGGSEEGTPDEGEQNPNPSNPNPNPNPENPGNGEGGENNGSNNGENNGGNGENNTNTPDPDDPWYNPDDEPD